MRYIPPYILAALALLLTACFAAPAYLPPFPLAWLSVPANIDAAPGEYNVGVHDLDAFSGKLFPQNIQRTHRFANVYTLKADGLTQETLTNILGGSIDWIEPNYILKLDTPSPTPHLAPLFAQLTPNDPMLPQQYAHTRMSTYGAWDVTRGAGITIAIADTGVECTHPDLNGQCVAGRGFIEGTDTRDLQGHGTHVAGIAAAIGNNNLGVAGVAYQARIMPVRVLGSNGSGDHGTISEGITWAADNGANIVNMSLGGQYGSQTLQAAVDYAWGRGVILTCAAGNSGSASPAYPAAYPNCLSVVATDSADRRAGYSNYGSTVDIAAPGSAVLSTVRGGGYQAWDGTSMAAPNVAGAVALVWAAHPGWTNAQVRAALENNADVIGSRAEYGNGRVNIPRAIGNVSPVPTIPPVTPVPAPATPTPASPPINEYEAETVRLINVRRGENGLGALTTDSRLGAAADFHNQWMLDHNCFSHICPGEPDPGQRIRNAGYSWISYGEIIAIGYQTPADVVTAWMNSAGHRANILGRFVDVGCGYLRKPGGLPWDSLWTCAFGVSDNSAPPPFPTRTLLPATPSPVPTLTPIVRPTLVTPRPLPTATPPPGGGEVWFTIKVYRNADSRAIVEASRLCGYGYYGVRCE